MDKLTLIKVGGKIVEEQETLSRLLVSTITVRIVRLPRKGC